MPDWPNTKGGPLKLLQLRRSAAWRMAAMPMLHCTITWERRTCTAMVGEVAASWAEPTQSLLQRASRTCLPPLSDARIRVSTSWNFSQNFSFDQSGRITRSFQWRQPSSIQWAKQTELRPQQGRPTFHALRGGKTFCASASGPSNRRQRPSARRKSPSCRAARPHAGECRRPW